MLLTAYELLLSDPLYYISMIAPLQRKTGRVLVANDDGILLHDIKSGAYFLSASSQKAGLQMMELMPEAELIMAFQEFMIEPLQSKFGLNHLHTCRQAVYFHKQPTLGEESLAIRQLQAQDYGFLWEHYHDLVDADYLHRRLSEGMIYGGFLEETCVGFIGEHEEGSIGILEILPDYRRCGYGTELTKFMINLFLSQNRIPFSQIEPDNEASMRLHSSLGFTIDTRCVYWLFNENIK